MIPAQVISEIKEKARIEDVIGHFINIERKGHNYWAVCPFHQDSSPSLSINVDKQIFKCFSCPSENNSAGDVFRFVEKYKKCSYIEAVKIVAELIGYTYDFGGTTPKETFIETITHKINYDTVAFCRNALNAKVGFTSKQYLLNRGITEEMMNRFDIGYNPADNGLYQFLKRKGYQDADLIAANVAKMTSTGMKDVFYDRIMIPIADVDGHPIGFTARTIYQHVDSKYINSTDTPVFNKSKCLYNFHRAKKAMKEKKYVILAEGPMDVIAFDKAGLANAVCSLGTSVTKEQIALIKRYIGSVVLAFDGDSAGQGATLRVGKMAIEAGLKVKVINNNTDDDPDEIVQKYGSGELVAMIEKPKSWLEFILEHYRKVYDISNYQQKKEYANKVVEQINGLTDSFDQSNYMNQLSLITGFSVDSLQQLLPNNDSNPNLYRRPSKTIVHKIHHQPVTLSGEELAQKEILNQMLKSKKATELYKEKLAYLPDETCQALANAIISYYHEASTMDEAILIGQIVDQKTSSLLYHILENKLLCQNESEAILNDAIIEIKIHELEKQKMEYAKKRKNMTQTDVIIKYCQLQAEVDKEIKQLKNAKSRRK